MTFPYWCVCLTKSEPILNGTDRLCFAPAERSGAAEFPLEPPLPPRPRFKTEFCGREIAEAAKSKNAMTNFSKNLLWITIIVLVIGGFALLRNNRSSESTKVRIGVVTVPHVSLVKIAFDKGFFREEGVEVETKEFTAGKFALQALIGGSLELTTVAELPVVLATINGEKLSVVSVINETVGGIPMILRKDGDTFDPKTYFSKKRKIATTIGAGVEFFTAEFFKKYEIPASQYEIVGMKPEDIPIVFANGDVDGIAIFEPFTSFAIQKAGEDKVFNIKDSDLYSEIMILVGKENWVLQNEKTIEKVLRALKKAETFSRDNPKESIEIVSSLTKLDEETLNGIWGTFTKQLGLNNSLISTMEREAQWAKDTGKVPKETAIPNFRDMIFEMSLKKVSPFAVEL